MRASKGIVVMRDAHSSRSVCSHRVWQGRKLSKKLLSFMDARASVAGAIICTIWADHLNAFALRDALIMIDCTPARFFALHLVLYENCLCTKSR